MAKTTASEDMYNPPLPISTRLKNQGWTPELRAAANKAGIVQDKAYLERKLGLVKAGK